MKVEVDLTLEAEEEELHVVVGSKEEELVDALAIHGRNIALP